MTPEQWRQIKEVLGDALALAPADRPAFLDHACSDDLLREQVDLLLSCSDEARSSFLQSSMLRLTLMPGTKLGDYEVQRLLGSGGMGEVYGARDLRLARDVAIKVLPSFLSHDPDRLRRFEQEARAAAALNHPNILGIFQMGTYQGTPYLVSELLEGGTLRDHLMGGSVPVHKAIEYGVQIARGLSAVHEKGIVHRDLKPENVFVTNDGRVKILDFGLAKLTHRQATSNSRVSTATQGTDLGVVMGTVGYMSPEQVGGQPADHRADIFAFGTIMYELLTGKRAFQKPTSAETMSAILNEEPPPMSQIRANIAPALQSVVNRCLEKNPEQRFQSASDLVFALDTLSDAGGVVGNTSRIRKKAALGLWILVAILLFGISLAWLVRNWQVRAPEMKPRQLTTNSSENPVTAGAISPDGKYLAYADSTGIYLRVVSTGEVHTVPGLERASIFGLSWFPDGTKLLVTGGAGKPADSTLWVISILGDRPRKLRDDVGVAIPSSDGSQIAFTSSAAFGFGQEIWLMGSGGEDARRVVEGGYMAGVQWFPNGQRLLYARVEYGKYRVTVESCDLRGGQPSVIVSDPRVTGGCLLPDGRVIYALAELPPNDSDTNLWSVTVNLETGEAAGKPRRLTNWSGFSLSGLFSITENGKRLAFLKRTVQADVFVAELGEKPSQLTNARRLTFDDRNDFLSGWMPDSQAVLFSSDRNGNFDVFRQASDQNTAELVVGGPDNESGTILTPDGGWILYSASPASSRFSGPVSASKAAESTSLMRAPISGGPAQLIIRKQASAEVRCTHSPVKQCVLLERHQKELTFYALDPLQGQGRELASTEYYQSGFL